MKILGMMIAVILLTGIFATAFVLANEEIENISELEDENLIGDSSIVNESEAAIEDFRIIGAKAVTLAEGWMISSGDDKAEILRSLWISGKYLNADAEKVKELRELYKDDKEKFKEELAKLGEVSYFSHGRLDIGLGDNKDKFKLVKKEISNNTASFYVLAISEKYKLNESDLASKSVGSLTLEKKQYPNLVMWTGNLILNSGKNAGTWNVSLASKTKLLKKAVALQVKKSFWQRLMFWKKAEDKAGMIAEKADEKQEKLIEKAKEAREKAREKVKTDLEY